MVNVQGLGSGQLVVTTVPDGDEGTAQTLSYAKQLIDEGVREPAVRALALKYIQRLGVPAWNKSGELYAIFAGVLKDFKFRDDPAGTELLQPVLGILEKRAGDCDDLNVILLCSLLGSIGFSTRAVTVKADPQRPEEDSHVYMQAQLPSGEWVALDVARQSPRFGREPERFWDKKVWPMTQGNQFLNGLGAMAPWQNGQPARIVKVVRRGKFPRRGLGDDGDFLDDSSDPLQGSYTVSSDLTGDTFDMPASAVAPSFLQGSTPSSSLNLSQVLNPVLAATPSILTGVAQVVKANNTPGIAVSGVTSGTTGTTSGISGGFVLLALLGIVGLAVFSGRG